VKRVVFSSRIGNINIQCEDESITGISFTDDPITVPLNPDENTVLTSCQNQLQEYFDGLRKSFTFSYCDSGTKFHLLVRQMLLDIPFGKTLSYSALARRMGRPEASRAIAGAIAANPLLIILPCHRVIGKNGALTGYAGGIHRKESLLQLEGLPVGIQQNLLL
jgi:methylated-DNA-[protein]-cysteine S-methyltransferase